jgi:hypothetical protein
LITYFAPSSEQGILGKKVGVATSGYQIYGSGILVWVESVQSKIRRTVFATRVGHEFFHPWEEHLRQRGSIQHEPSQTSTSSDKLKIDCFCAFYTKKNHYRESHRRAGRRQMQWRIT